MKGIAKSISKWVGLNFSQESFKEYIKTTHSPEIQKKRGILSGISRRKGSIEFEKPWISLGISRRQYFYLKKRGQNEDKSDKD